MAARAGRRTRAPNAGGTPRVRHPRPDRRARAAADPDAADLPRRRVLRRIRCPGHESRAAEPARRTIAAGRPHDTAVVSIFFFKYPMIASAALASASRRGAACLTLPAPARLTCFTYRDSTNAAVL